MTTSNISPFLPYLPSLFSTIVPFTEFPPSSDSGLCCGIIFLSPVKMCHSDWFSKKANQSITWQDFQGREDAGKRKVEMSETQSKHDGQDGDETIKPRSRK